jgi:hypothetical protein
MMTCEQIRETLDTVKQSEAATRHLQGCAACRKEAAATAKLVSLLNAQPRVKAPVDFMAQLQQRMAKEAVNEDVRLKSLLQSIPAVSAPPDFAFRVRARLARTKAPARNPLASIGEWLKQSFTLGQAATAMAAVALIAVFTTVQMRNGSVTAPQENIARVEFNAPVQPEIQSPAVTVEQPVASVSRVVRAPRSSFSATPVKATTTVTPKAEVALAAAVSGALVEPAVYNARTRQGVAGLEHGYAFGQQLGKAIAAQPKPETLLASAAF